MRLYFSLCFLCIAWCTQADQRGQSSAISLNPVGRAFAQQLIREGRVVLDQKGAWKRDQPSIAQKNEFIRSCGFEEYAKWHLGIDERHGADAKAHYKFPFGDFKALHRCGLLAVKARAREYGHHEIEAVAQQLLKEIVINSPRR